jgi:hypothetical protein
MSRLSARPAFAQAYSDLADFSLDIPEEKRAAWQEKFTG